MGPLRMKGLTTCSLCSSDDVQIVDCTASRYKYQCMNGLCNHRWETLSAEYLKERGEEMQIAKQKDLVGNTVDPNAKYIKDLLTTLHEAVNTLNQMYEESHIVNGIELACQELEDNIITFVSDKYESVMEEGFMEFDGIQKYSDDDEED